MTRSEQNIVKEKSAYTMNKFRRFIPITLPFLAFIVFLWLTGGFELWSLGETRNWLKLLQDGPGAVAARGFWALDSRNPLSPWWYILLARPLLQQTSAAMFILHLAVGFFVSVATFLMVDEATLGRARLFATGLAISVSMFAANFYLDSIHWNLLGALGFSLLSVWAYARFVNGGRSSPHLYVASLLCFFIALATYSIQCGAVVAITLLAFVSKNTLRERIAVVIKDVSAYAVLFLLFVLIWKTTSLLGVASLPLNPTLAGFVKSVQQAIWHGDYALFGTWASSVGVRGIVGALAVAAIAFWAGRSASRDAAPTRLADLGLVFALGLALVVPTIALETSSDTWVPGSRTRMVMQFWTPLLACTLFALISLVLPQPRQRTVAWLGMVAAFVFYSVLCDIGMNDNQRARTANERVFIAKLRAVAEEDLGKGAAFPRHYIISYTSPNGPSDHFVYQGYTRTEMPSLPPVTYRYFPSNPGLPITFEADGVVNPASHVNEKVPYARVGFLHWDGQGFKRLAGPDELTK